jgi:hypothetical protein
MILELTMKSVNNVNCVSTTEAYFLDLVHVNGRKHPAMDLP